MCTADERGYWSAAWQRGCCVCMAGQGLVAHLWRWWSMPGSITRALSTLLRPSPSALDVCGNRATAILVLGGEREREEFAARLASKRRWRGGTLPLFISSGSYRYAADFDPTDLANPHLHRMSGVDFARLRSRLVMDRRAVDTVTNFTTMVEMLAQTGHRRLLIVTSNSHLRRSRACAAVVLGSHDIEFSFRACDADVAPAHGAEPWGTARTVRDVARCLMWVCYGLSGETIARWRHPDRT